MTTHPFQRITEIQNKIFHPLLHHHGFSSGGGNEIQMPKTAPHTTILNSLQQNTQKMVDEKGK